MSLIPVQDGDIAVGQPLPWSIFDQDSQLLMMEGEVVTTDDQLQLLMDYSPMRALDWEESTPEPGETTAAPPAPDEVYRFSDMRLKVGDRLQIQPPAQLTSERFTVRLIGYLDGQSVLVTPPYANGLRLPLQEGENIIVRYFSGQNAFGFSASINKISKLPYEYFHLSFPESVKGMIIRKAPRVRTRIIAAVLQPDQPPGADPKSAIIANMSASGALLDSRHALGEKGDTLRLTFRVHLHNVDALLRVNAAIRAVFEDETPDPDKPCFIHHGIEFQGLEPNDSVILQSLIYQQMVENPHTLA